MCLPARTRGPMCLVKVGDQQVCVMEGGGQAGAQAVKPVGDPGGLACEAVEASDLLQLDDRLVLPVHDPKRVRHRGSHARVRPWHGTELPHPRYERLFRFG